jgi:hypothetical protein
MLLLLQVVQAEAGLIPTLVKTDMVLHLHKVILMAQLVMEMLVVILTTYLVNHLLEAVALALEVMTLMVQVEEQVEMVEQIH